MKFRVTLREALAGVLAVGLVCGLIVRGQRHRRQIQELQFIISETRDTIQMVEHGQAVLSIAARHPSIQEDTQSMRIIRHDLAFSVIQYWEYETVIDSAMKTPGFSKEFAAESMEMLGCSDADEFITMSRGNLWVYPDDELHSAASSILHDSKPAFDEFLKSAISLYGMKKQ